MADQSSPAQETRLAEIEARLKGYSFVSGANHGLADDLRYVLDLLVAEARGRQQAEQERDAAEAQCAEHQRGENDALNRLQQAEQARDAARQESEWRGQKLQEVGRVAGTWRTEAERAQAREAVLTQALKDYGQHQAECGAGPLASVIGHLHEGKCTCGFDAALTGAQA